MKVGDLVKHYFTEGLGIILREVHDPLCSTTTNKVFDILWQEGTIGHNVWSYDLEAINESR